MKVFIFLAQISVVLCGIWPFRKVPKHLFYFFVFVKICEIEVEEHHCTIQMFKLTKQKNFIGPAGTYFMRFALLETG